MTHLRFWKQIKFYFLFHFFDQAFEDLIVRDSEFVAVELTAKDKKGSFESTIFQGSVRYEALKRTYDNRVSVKAFSFLRNW